MNINLIFPKEILAVVFKNLCHQDLVSCSRTCWTWNDTANSLLYETISISTHTMFQEFIESINDFQNHRESCTGSTVNEDKQLGLLVKVVDILVDYSQDDNICEYPAMLLNLASKTPNVHTSKLFLPDSYSDHGSNSSFDWSILASRWTRLKSLTLAKGMFQVMEGDLNNINDVLNRLQYLDVDDCSRILTYMMPSLPTMPYLQSLIVLLYDVSEYQVLKKILKTCQRTMNALIIRMIEIPELLYIDLDDLDICHKQLQTFGLATSDISKFQVTDFGDSLENLELKTFRNGNIDISDRSMSQAMIKTRKLKSLYLENMSVELIPLVLEANKNTLHTLFFRSRFEKSNNLISNLLAKKVRVCNVIKLFFESWNLANSDLHSLSEIFPNVEFLMCGLVYLHAMSMRPWIDKRLQWITADALSHFQHLKVIDEITFMQVIDNSLVIYQRCNIPWYVGTGMDAPTRGNFIVGGK